MITEELLSPTATPLGLGTWQAYDYANADANAFEKVIFKALDCGIRFFDSAESYGNGEAEKLLGRAIKATRHELVVSTKFSHHHSRPDLIEKSLMKSMRRLGTDYIDMYLQHWPPHEGPREETIEKLIALKQAGAVRAIGVCNWRKEDFEFCEQYGDELDCIQLGFNFLWRHELENVSAYIDKYKLSVFAYSPLAQGLLTKGTIQEAYYDARDKLVFKHDKYQKLLERVREYFTELSKLHKTSLAGVALAWVRSHPLIALPIIGASKPEQLEDLCKSLEVSIVFEDAPIVDVDLHGYKSMWDWRP